MIQRLASNARGAARLTTSRASARLGLTSLVRASARFVFTSLQRASARLDHPRIWKLACAALLVLGLACGRSAPVIPRTLGGTTTRGAFVPPSSYEAHMRGELLLAQGRAAEAVAQFELATASPEEDPYLLSRLAYAQLLAGDRAAAERTLRHAAALDDCSEAVWLTRGLMDESQADFAAARAAFAKATDCAPSSPDGELALARLLERQGEAAAALDVLVRAAERPFGARASTELQRSLRAADDASFAHALSGLGTQRAPDASALERAIALALERGLPRLALRLREQHTTRLPPRLEAEILRTNRRTDELAALLAVTDAQQLGGHARAAELALEARAYERAELEATSALQRGPSEPLYALRARALLALGRMSDALRDLSEIDAHTPLGRTLALELLAATGAPALARELNGKNVAPQ